MVRTPDSSEDLFAEAATNWDLQKLYKDLAVAKREFAPYRRPLTDTEKKHLRGLLCGYSPAEMAKKLHKSARGVEADLCSTIYRYVEQLTKQPLNTLKNWRDLPEWLEQTGYKIQVFDAVDGEKAIASSPSEDIEALVQKVRSHFNKTIQDQCANLCTFNLFYTPVLRNLSRMYVQTKLHESQGGGAGYFSQERQLWEQVVLKHSKLMVLGKPGAGKTTLLQYIALNSDEIEFQPKLVPIFISLETLADNVKRPDEIDILGYIQNKYCCSNVSEQELESLLSHGRLLFLLDGLDEVTEEKISIVNTQIHKLIASNNRFIISCRKESQAYQSKKFARFIFVKIADLDRTQRDYFIEKWFDEVAVIAQPERSAKANDLIKKLDLPKNQRIRELTDTPLLLHLICLIFQARGDLPSKRVELYREAIDLLLEKWNQFNERLHIDVAELKKFLRRIAAITFEAGKSYFEEAEIALLSANCPQTLSTTEVLSGLIVKKGWRQYAFSHQTFQEYLTAEEFVNSKQLLSQLIINITEPRWREVFLLVAEMLMPADDLLRSIKESIDRLLENQIFQDFLQWLDDKSTQVKEVENVRYKLASIRAIYFDLGLELNDGNYFYTEYFEDTLAYAIDPAINDNLDSALDLDFKLYHALRFENFYNSFWYGIPSSLNLPLDLDLANNHLNFLIHSTPNPELQYKLQELKDCILEPEADFEHRQERWKAHRFTWMKQLRDMMIKYRNIGHTWLFNKEQIKLLKQYYEANKLLWECLAISNVSVEVRSHIENNLFLPLDSSLS
ncbi:NACHT domain-containing protein [Microcoleus sp. AT9_B5]